MRSTLLAASLTAVLELEYSYLNSTIPNYYHKDSLSMWKYNYSLSLTHSATKGGDAYLEYAIIHLMVSG